MMILDRVHASVDNKKVLKGISLTVNPGEIHMIIGPNGSGKSSFANVIAGNPHYKVNSGSILFEKEDLLALPPEKRAYLGIFLGFQAPIGIPGIPLISFLRTTVNSVREQQGKDNLSTNELIARAKNLASNLGLHEQFLERPINIGFSGGEKKRTEMLQLAMLEPKLSILDEIDSGLDRDALISVATFLKKYMNLERSLIIISHYVKLLDLLPVSHVHLFNDGNIIMSGGKELAHRIEAEGYEALLKEKDAVHS